MKITRQKKAHRFISFYVNNFNFRAPFQILIDGTYCFAALRNKHDIQDNLPRYFQNDLKFLTTPCVVIETEKLGDKVIGAMIIVKKFAVHNCIHTKNPVAGSACIKSMIGKDNANRYFVATQDRELQDYLRKIPGVPLIYLHQRTPVLEHPTAVSENFAKNLTLSIVKVGGDEAERLEALKKTHGIEKVETHVKRKKRKSGPNPLSIKKKKKKIQGGNVQKNTVGDRVEKRKRNRKRIKMAEHVKKELFCKK